MAAEGPEYLGPDAPLVNDDSLGTAHCTGTTTRAQVAINCSAVLSPTPITTMILTRLFLFLATVGIAAALAIEPPPENKTPRKAELPRDVNCLNHVVFKICNQHLPPILLSVC